MNQPEVELEDLGLIDYKQCWDYQTKLFDASVQLKIKNRKFPENRVSTKNHLIFCEHPHVYTLGKSGLQYWQELFSVGQKELIPWSLRP